MTRASSSVTSAADFNQYKHVSMTRVVRITSLVSTSVVHVELGPDPVENLVSEDCTQEGFTYGPGKILVEYCLH